MKIFQTWKYPFILLFGIGISNIGDWIYLIALNLIVFDMTESPLAVAVLYILKPLATLSTNAWAGSIIDRLNKRNLMVFLDLFRTALIIVLPLISTLWIIYLFVFIINMGSSMFYPTSMTYITKLIPVKQRKRFNSLRSLVQSGGFLIGPAIAGILFIFGTPEFAIYINALSFLISGLFTMLMPNLEQNRSIVSANSKLSLRMVKKDWAVVLNFSRRYVYVMSVYFLFSSMIVMISAVDSLEAAFAKEILRLSNVEYGFLVSIAGLAVVSGAVVNMIFSRKLHTSLLMGVGSIFVSLGYICYAFSGSFLIAAIGFFVLSFSLAFANTGFLTFYQNNIPVDVMGRVGSIYGLIEATLVIISTVLFGFIAQMISIQFAVIVGALVMMVFTATLCLFNIQPSKKLLYEVDEQMSS